MGSMATNGSVYVGTYIADFYCGINHSAEVLWMGLYLNTTTNNIFVNIMLMVKSFLTLSLMHFVNALFRPIEDSCDVIFRNITPRVIQAII